MFSYIVYYLFSWIWTSERFRSFLPLVGITGPSDTGNEVALIEQSPESLEAQEAATLGAPGRDLQEIAFMLEGTDGKPSNPFHQPVSIEVSIKASVGRSPPLGKTVRGTLMVPQAQPKPTTTLCTVPPPGWGLSIPADTLSVAIMLIWIFAMVWFRLLPRLTGKKRAMKLSHKSVQTGNDQLSMWIYRNSLARSLKKRKIPDVLCEDDLAKKIKSHMEASGESSAVLTAEELLESLAQFRERMAEFERNASLEEHQVNMQTQTDDDLELLFMISNFQPMEVDEYPYPYLGQLEDGEARVLYYIEEEGGVEFIRLELMTRNVCPEDEPEDLNHFYDFLHEIDYFNPDFHDFLHEIDYFYPDFCDLSQEYPHYPEDFVTDYEDAFDLSLDDFFSNDEDATGDGMMKLPGPTEAEEVEAPEAAAAEGPTVQVAEGRPIQVPDVEAEAEVEAPAPAPEDDGRSANQVLWHLENGLQYVVNCQVLSDEDCQLDAGEDLPKDDQGAEEAKAENDLEEPAEDEDVEL